MWLRGRVRINDRNFNYEIKRYDQPTEYGIQQGRISKLEIRLDHETVMVRYDRGWDVTTEDKDATTALGFLIRKYN